jgi:transcriptional regulator with XRE-family HTH domain
MNILELIGKNIKFYRNRAGISQESLAELSGLHRTYIGAVERGERNISAINIFKIAAALDIEPHILLIKVNCDS